MIFFYFISCSKLHVDGGLKNSLQITKPWEKIDIVLLLVRPCISIPGKTMGECSIWYFKEKEIKKQKIKYNRLY